MFPLLIPDDRAPEDPAVSPNPRKCRPQGRPAPVPGAPCGSSWSAGLEDWTLPCSFCPAGQSPETLEEPPGELRGRSDFVSVGVVRVTGNSAAEASSCGQVAS